MASTSGSCSTGSRASPGGAAPGEWSIRPASISPRAKASSCTSPVASTSSSATSGHSTRNSRTQAGSFSKPMVETKAMRTRPTCPAAAARALSGKGLRAGQQLAHVGQQGFAGRRERHAPARPVEQRHAQCLLELGNGLRDGRLGHVQALGGAAEMQLFGHGHELAPGTQVDQGFLHMPSISIHIQKGIGMNQ